MSMTAGGADRRHDEPEGEVERRQGDERGQREVEESPPRPVVVLLAGRKKRAQSGTISIRSGLSSRTTWCVSGAEESGGARKMSQRVLTSSPVFCGPTSLYRPGKG